MKLRPFFSYYGGKWRDAPRLYPPPVHRVIVEPFAGSAGYAVRHYDRQVVLVEKSRELAAIWRFLIHEAEPGYLLSLPDLKPGQTIDDIEVPEVVRLLVGMWLNRGAAAPKRSPSSWMRSGVRPGSFWGPRVREVLASQVPHIRHWRVIEGDYTDAPDINATWFIDPPYQQAGRHYPHGSDGLDFPALGQWCGERKGQVIVCEATGADWLPFEHAADTKTPRKGKRSQEDIWLGGVQREQMTLL